MVWKPMLLRIGWMCYILSLLLPALSVQQDQAADMQVASGWQFVMQSLLPLWWQQVPLALPIAAANVVCLASICLPGLSTRHRKRTWALALPCLAGFASGLLIPSIMTIHVGYLLWMLALLLLGVGALFRIPQDAITA